MVAFCLTLIACKGENAAPDDNTATSERAISGFALSLTDAEKELAEQWENTRMPEQAANEKFEYSRDLLVHLILNSKKKGVVREAASTLSNQISEYGGPHRDWRDAKLLLQAELMLQIKDGHVVKNAIFMIISMVTSGIEISDRLRSRLIELSKVGNIEIRTAAWSTAVSEPLSESTIKSLRLLQSDLLKDKDEIFVRMVLRVEPLWGHAENAAADILTVTGFLRHAVPSVRIAAVNRLDQLWNLQNTPAAQRHTVLLSLLKDAHPAVRGRIIENLGKTENTSMIHLLMPSLTDRKEPSWMSRIYTGAGGIGGKSGGSDISRAKTNTELTLVAIATLGKPLGLVLSTERKELRADIDAHVATVREWYKKEKGNIPVST